MTYECHRPYKPGRWAANDALKLTLESIDRIGWAADAYNAICTDGIPFEGTGRTYLAVRIEQELDIHQFFAAAGEVLGAGAQVLARVAHLTTHQGRRYLTFPNVEIVG